MSDPIKKKIKPNIALNEHTNIGLGGPAQNFVTCTTSSELIAALRFADEHNLLVYLLGGGTNTVFADNGFSGLVINIAISGLDFTNHNGHTVVTADAGEEWDNLVKQCVDKNLAGLECLSGIPGRVGATPMQNVGAYGQEVAQTITQVKVVDRNTLKETTFTNEECQFEYRGSRFKYRDAGRYVITRVSYRLARDGQPTVQYPDIIAEIGDRDVSLQSVRDATLAVRRRKSMLVDPADPHSRSCGSFFINPVLDKEKMQHIQNVSNHQAPTFPAGNKTKVPAAWLIEQAGFLKGYRQGNVGISPNHNLALVNYGGTTEELLNLAQDIKTAVKNKFNIELQQEPVLVTSE